MPDICSLRSDHDLEAAALERGDSEPGTSVLLAISREFGKSVDWLLTGEEKK